MDSLYLPQSKKNANAEKAIIVHEDEASFRQTTTLHQTWAPINDQPKIATKGVRNTQKIFGAVALSSGKFVHKHHQEGKFNYETYIEFLDYLVSKLYKKNHRIYLIQDNASYHKKQETYEWFSSNRKYIEVFNLPPYCPELNAVERVWHYTRMAATHNRYYDSKEELCAALSTTFKSVQENPSLIKGLLAPFS